MFLVLRTHCVLQFPEFPLEEGDAIHEVSRRPNGDETITCIALKSSKLSRSQLDFLQNNWWVFYDATRNLEDFKLRFRS